MTSKLIVCSVSTVADDTLVDVTKEGQKIAHLCYSLTSGVGDGQPAIRIVGPHLVLAANHRVG